MARVLPPLLVLALLGASAGALATDRAPRASRTPVYAVSVGPLFSPVCECAHDRVRIRFFLRQPDRLTVDVRDGDGAVVGTVAHDKPYPRGWVRLTWNGIQESGIAVADGTYHPAVHLAGGHRTIVLPNELRVDTTPPVLIGAQAKPLVLSPDGDGRGDTLAVRYRGREPARGVLIVDGRRRVTGARLARAGSVRFTGTVGRRPLAAGGHTLAFAAEDSVGNTSPPQRIGTLTIRYVALARKLVSAGPGERFYVRVSADARRVEWRFGGRSGRARPGTLVFRAPPRPGTYRLSVAVGSHTAAARVRVERIG